ncbi:NAD(P)-dependent oxidoreductase [Aciditerrimonas ferrireducens]|uniref:NAD(P)-dependent oxidoreductase n=1 Tax=Aciditerrimonas ferrireducens TaxID=667306 RepID=UPI002004AAE9|nr:NAD(P)-binding domain-containing protein [Aciditerrimonas ferrireducens]MCK4176592.1 NAD(P)-binding domain-containing protein [Aciditerrimonas ferrireducens]
MHLALLGTGRMGTAIAQRLLEAGHDVTVWNRTRSKTAAAAAAGAVVAESPGAAVAGAEVVLVSLADDAAVLATVDEALAEALSPGSVLVDASTVGPTTSREEQRRLGPDRFLAAPVLGAPEAVRGRAATLLLGGPEQARLQLAALWEDLAGAHVVCGEDPALATTMKLVANYLLLGSLAVCAEAVATAQAAGVAPKVLEGFLRSSPLVAPGLQNRLDLLLGQDHRGWFAPALGAKDVRLFEQLAANAALRLPVAPAVAAAYQATAEGADPASGAEEDVAAVVEVPRGNRPLRTH